VQVANAVETMLFIQMNDDLSVSLSGEAMPLASESVPQFDEVVDLAV
jgi:hypothetical protein